MTDVTAQSFSPPPVRPASAINVGDVFTKARHVFVARWITYLGIMAIGYAPFLIAVGVATFAATHPDAFRGMESPVAIIAISVAIVFGVVGTFCLLVAPA